MINLPKVRYAVLVAAVGVAVTFWPGLTPSALCFRRLWALSRPFGAYGKNTGVRWTYTRWIEN